MMMNWLEKIWDLKKNPAKMTKEIVEISNKLADAKKKPKTKFRVFLILLSL